MTSGNTSAARPSVVMDLVEAAVRTGRRKETVAHVEAARAANVGRSPPALPCLRKKPPAAQRSSSTDPSRRPWRFLMRDCGHSTWRASNSPTANGPDESSRQLRLAQSSPPHSTRSSVSVHAPGRSGPRTSCAPPASPSDAPSSPDTKRCRRSSCPARATSQSGEPDWLVARHVSGPAHGRGTVASPTVSGEPALGIGAETARAAEARDAFPRPGIMLDEHPEHGLCKIAAVALVEQTHCQLGREAANRCSHSRRCEMRRSAAARPSPARAYRPGPAGSGALTPPPRVST